MTVTCRLSDIGMYLQVYYPRLKMGANTVIEAIPTSANTLIVRLDDSVPVDLPLDKYALVGVALTSGRATEQQELPMPVTKRKAKPVTTVEHGIRKLDLPTVTTEIRFLGTRNWTARGQRDDPQSLVMSLYIEFPSIADYNRFDNALFAYFAQQMSMTIGPEDRSADETEAKQLVDFTRELLADVDLDPLVLRDKLYEAFFKNVREPGSDNEKIVRKQKEARPSGKAGVR